MAIIRVNWTNFYSKQSAGEAENAVNLWATMFADEPADDVLKAVKAIIRTSTSGFPPSIGQVAAKLDELRNPNRMTEQEAWAIVIKAVKRLDPTAPSREFDKLPPAVQAAVGSPDVLYSWAFEMDTTAFNSVAASNFQRSYRAASTREETSRMMLPGGGLVRIGGGANGQDES
jgi:hypothetical protein